VRSRFPIAAHAPFFRAVDLSGDSIVFFFDERYATFEPFTLAHFLPVLLVIAAVVLIVVFRERLRADARFDRRFRIAFALVTVVMEWIYDGWVILRGGANFTLLPFGLCVASMYLTALALLTGSETLFKIVYPWAVAGAILSLVVADMSYTFPHFRYFHYFGLHGMFLIANVYMAATAKTPYRHRDVLRSSGILLAVAIPMYFLNGLLGTNHLFLAELPAEVAPMFLWMGSPGWVFGFGFAMFLLFHLVSLPLILSGRRGTIAK